MNSGIFKSLSKLDQVNKATTHGDRFDETQMLLVTLSTIIAMAKDKPLDAKYYQVAKTYLQYVRGDEGQLMPNAEGFIRKIDWFVEKHKIGNPAQEQPIVDELEFSKFQLNVEAPTDDEEEADVIKPFGKSANVLSSTQNPSSENLQEEPVVDQEEKELINFNDSSILKEN